MPTLLSTGVPHWSRAAFMVSVAVLWGACAGGEVQDGDDGGGGSPPASGGSGGEGGEVGTGGSGAGDNGGSGGTSMGTPGPCAIDCSSIATPDCSIAVCNEGQHMGTIGDCVVVDSEDAEACEDGLFCTVNDSCVAGVCTAGNQNDCGLAPESCELITCDEASATCAAEAALDGDPCTSADLCTVNATCTAGECIGINKDCFFAPVPDECHVPVCNPANGVCEPVVGNDGELCTDANDLCTVTKTCVAGVCSGGFALDCSALTQGCFNGVCEAATGQCIQDPIMPGQQCAEATDDCNTGICDMNGLCVAMPTNEGGTCDDGLSCTSGTTCTTGSCGGGMSTINIYFAEDFGSNAAGWTLGAEWQIGAATASQSPGACGSGDPGQDHSSTTDNGVAGVVIGGNATTTIHPFAYITSPPIDTSTVVGPVLLSYHRWLNSDYTPYMQNNVEVFDGTSWVVLWQSGSSPGVEDLAWTPQSHDITAYKAANMQVRFGFNINSGGVFTCSQWNLDDVLIASGSCN
jgi:hypothetical protein